MLLRVSEKIESSKHQTVTMMRLPRLFPPLLRCLILLAFAGCASIPPEPVYQLSPVSEDTKWLNGQQLVQNIDDSVEIVIAFDRYAEGNLIFDMQIANYSSKPVLVAPETFYAVAARQLGRDTLGTAYAINPESQILAVDLQMSAEKSRYTEKQNSQAFGATLDLIGMFGSLVGDIVGSGKPKTEEEKERRQRQDETDANRRALRKQQEQLERIEHQNQIASLSDARVALERLPVRKTTLNSGMSLSGKVAFPPSRRATLLTFVFPVGLSLHEFRFRQTVIGADRWNQPDRAPEDESFTSAADLFVPKAFDLSVEPASDGKRETVAVITFDMPRSGVASVEVYDESGHSIGILVAGERDAGRYRVRYQSLSLANGTYLFRFQSGGFSATEKLVLAR